MKKNEHTPQGRRKTASEHSVVAWTLAQMRHFSVITIRNVLLGPIIAMVQRRFHWPAFIAGTLIMGLGIYQIGRLVPAWLATGNESARMAEHFLGESTESVQMLLWLGSLLVVTFAGIMIGAIGRRVGFWESVMAIGVVAMGLGLYLSGALSQLWAAQRPVDPQAGVRVFAADGFGAVTIPGEQLFGPMWMSFFLIAIAISLMLAVTGGSFAYLFLDDASANTPQVPGAKDRPMTPTPVRGLRGLVRTLFATLAVFKGVFGARDSFEWRLSLRYLRGNSRFISLTALVAVVGIALGVATLVAVTAVMSGYQEDVQEKMLSTNAHLVVRKYGIDFEEYRDVAAKGLTVPGVMAATPFTFNEAMLSDGDLGLGVLLKGVEPQSAWEVTDIANNLCDIDVLQKDLKTLPCVPYSDPSKALPALLPAGEEIPSLVVGRELFRRLEKPLGAEVMITTAMGIADARGNAPKRMRFRLAGVFRSGMHEFDSRLIYLHLTGSQRLMGLGKAVSGVEFRVKRPDKVKAVGKAVLKAVTGWPYHTLDWHELNHGIFTALMLQKIVMYLVLCCIVIVASFNIASTLFMAVVEKSHEIGVLKSMGARDASVMKIFVLEGWLVGSLGTVLGVIVGLLVCAALERFHIDIAADVYMVDSLVVRINPIEVVGTVVAAFLISHLATLYPALQAARQTPVDAMRYE